MSVDFTTTMSEIAAWAITCGIHDNGMRAERFGTWADADAFLRAERDARGGTGHLAICGDDICEAYPMQTYAIEKDPAPRINVSVFNAMFLLDLLGVVVEDGDEPCGSMAPEDFLGRVMMAEAVNPADPGVPATATRAGESVTLPSSGSNDALASLIAALTGTEAPAPQDEAKGITLIDCGRPEGYSDMRLVELRQLAEFAVDRGRQIQWS